MITIKYCFECYENLKNPGSRRIEETERQTMKYIWNKKNKFSY